MKLQHIKDFVDSEFQIDITKNTRERRYIEARSLYYFLAREYTPLSLTEIGRSLNRHHATVLHSINNVWDNAIRHNRWVRDSYSRFKKIAQKEGFEDQDIYSLQLKLIEANEEIFRLKSIDFSEYEDLRIKYEDLKKEYNKAQDQNKESERFNMLISQLDDDRKKEELYFKLEASVKLLKNAVYL